MPVSDYGSQFVTLANGALRIGNAVCPIVDNIAALKEEFIRTDANIYWGLFGNPKCERIRNEIDENLANLNKKADETFLKFTAEYSDGHDYDYLNLKMQQDLQRKNSLFDSYGAELFIPSGNLLGFKHQNVFKSSIKDSGSGKPSISVNLDTVFEYEGLKEDYLKEVSKIDGMGKTCVASVEFFPEIRDMASLVPTVGKSVSCNNSWTLGLRLREENDKIFGPDGTRIADKSTKSPYSEVMLDATVTGGPGIYFNLKANYRIEIPVSGVGPRNTLEFKFPDEEKQLIKEVINKLAPAN